MIDSGMRSEPEPSGVPLDGRAADEHADVVVRRAPFSDNPDVGARGQRTQQRIVDASLEVFGEKGYHQTSIDRITKVAGCSRVSFYQYFSGKEDLFRYLTGQVARQLSASAEALGTLTPDLEGWSALRAWVGRHADIYERYEPVFHAFQAAAESDEELAGGSVRTSERNVERIRSKLATTELPPRRLDPLVTLLLECVTRTHDTVGVLRPVAPAAYSRERMEDALTDVFHRTLFGVQPDVNVHPPAGQRPPVIEFGPVMRDVAEGETEEQQLTATGQRTLEALVHAGREVFVRRGYHRARVDDIVEEAGVSHGAFYRYFKNKDDLAHVVAVRAMRGVLSAFVEIPEAFPPGDAETRHTTLRWWLRRYNGAHAAETAVIRVWVDAARQDPSLRQDSAGVLDWGRRRLARFLRPRDFGDVEIDAVIMVALLSAFGSRERSAASIDSAAYIVERGLLGR
jgi:AcrR family transcriptional regulator